MTELAYLGAQENFPHEDLSEANTILLEMLMQNREIIGEYHTQAEQMSRLFVLGHKAIYATAYSNIEDGEPLQAFSNGISIYEIIESIIGRPHIKAIHNTPQALHYFIDDAPYPGFLELIDEARDKFDTTMPHTKHVIKASAARFHPGYVDYAITGAAMIHLVDTDVHAAVQEK